MITCDLQGGLGNIMFQVAAAYALAARNNVKSYFDLSKNIHCVTKHFDNLSEYKNNIFHNLNNHPMIEHTNHYAEKNFHYDPIPYKENLFVHGYYQSEKYFSDMKEDIRNLFSIPESIQNEIKSRYKLDFNSYVSIHVRRGDYIKFKNVHSNLDMTYFKNALTKTNKKKILAFSDDIQWMKQNFKNHDITFIENEKDYVDMYLMSLCGDNIIANSTFSWWGAWLNKNKDKKVICPKTWFGPTMPHNTKDLYPENWIKI